MVTSRLLIARLLLPLLLIGCDNRSEMLEPQGAPLASAAGAVGLYELTVVNGTDLGGGVWEITSRPPTFRAHVAFPNGTPVTKGTVVFQLGIGGRWERQQAVQVDQNGNATVAAGVALPAEFRFKYNGQGSGVKNGVSNAVTVRLAQ
jgi:hypothetical protein